MNRDDVYDDYRSLLRFKADEKTKAAILQRLVAQCTNRWRVVGITPKALESLSDSQFQFRGAGIQRAHLIDRDKTFCKLVRSETSSVDFWDSIAEGDTTVLALKTENKGIATVPYIALQDQGLFPPEGTYIFFQAKKIGFHCRRKDKKMLSDLSRFGPAFSFAKAI